MFSPIRETGQHVSDECVRELTDARPLERVRGAEN